MVLDTVDCRAKEMAAELSKLLPWPVVYKVTAKTNREITEVVREANFRDECAGVITWCHTFSPSKMWIDGLRDPWWQSITTGAMLCLFILLQSVVLMRKNRKNSRK